jgi:outer membrane lipoprotein LolB
LRAAGAAVTLALLGACATVPPPGPDALSGRLSVVVEADAQHPRRSLATQFELFGSAQRGQLRLNSPLGNTLAQASWQPAGAELQTSDGTTRYATLDAMAQQLLGEALPLAAIIDWLHGRPWAGAPSEPQAGGFSQLGWTVDLSRRAEGWVIASRAAPPAVSVRARLDAPL